MLFLRPPIVAAEVDFVGGLSTTTLSAEATKGLGVDGWSGRFDVSRPLPGFGRLSLVEDLDVRLRRIPGYRRQWRVDQSLDLRLDRPISESAGLLVTASGQDYRDQLAGRYPAAQTPPHSPFLPPYLVGGQSKEGSHLPAESELSGVATPPAGALSERIQSLHIGAGGSWRPNPLFVMQALAGPIHDERGGAPRDGVRYDLALDVGDTNVAAPRWKGEGWLERFPPGDNHSLETELAGRYDFSDDAPDRFSVLYLTGSNREFSPVTQAIGRRRDERLHIRNGLEVLPQGNIRFAWESDFSRRSARGNLVLGSRRDRELVWKNNLATGWDDGDRMASIEGGLDVQQQEYAGGLTLGRRTRLGLVVALRPAPGDSTVAEAGTSRYRFDTPDPSDFNDRDELRFTFALRSGLRLTSALSIRAGLEGNLNHLVYLYRARSGENRWTRQLTLYAELPWRDPPLDNRARFAVASHFTDYDYAPFDETESRVFRAYSATDTLRLEWGQGWGVELSGAGQLDDYGSLRWEKWTQDVSEEGHSYTIAGLPYRHTAGLEAAVGWLLHRRLTKLQTAGGGSGTGQDVRSGGPTARLIAHPAPGAYVEFSATLLTIREAGQDRQRRPDVNLAVLWNL